MVTSSLSRLQVTEAQRHGIGETRKTSGGDFVRAVGELLEMKMFLHVGPMNGSVYYAGRRYEIVLIV
jgi:hypothetical protein